MDKFKFTPENGFRDSSSYPNPSNATETREQLQRPLDQIKEYINKMALLSILKMVRCGLLHHLVGM